MPLRESILLRNNVRVAGAEGKPTMVFAHGFGCDQNMWRFVAPAFAETHRIALFDYVGCGRSDLSTPPAAARSKVTRRSCSRSARRSTCSRWATR